MARGEEVKTIDAQYLMKCVGDDSHSWFKYIACLTANGQRVGNWREFLGKHGFAYLLCEITFNGKWANKKRIACAGDNGTRVVVGSKFTKNGAKYYCGLSDVDKLYVQKL